MNTYKDMLVDIGLLYNAYTNLNEKQRDTYINKIHIICKYKHIIYIYLSISIHTFILKHVFISICCGQLSPPNGRSEDPSVRCEVLGPTPT